MFGSNAKAEGGMLGRVDAVYTSIEAQHFTGSRHAHSQVVVQAFINIQVCQAFSQTTSQAAWRHN